MVNVNEIRDKTYEVITKQNIPFICYNCMMKPMCSYTKSGKCRREMNWLPYVFLYPAFAILRKHNADVIIKLQYSIDDRMTYNMTIIKDIDVMASLDDNRILRLSYDRTTWHKYLLCAKSHSHVTEPDVKYDIVSKNTEKYVRIEGPCMP